MEEFTETIERSLDKIEGKQEAQAKSQAELHVRLKKLENDRPTFSREPGARPRPMERGKPESDEGFIVARKSLILSPVSADLVL